VLFEASESVTLLDWFLCMGFDFDVFLANSIVVMYCRFGCIDVGMYVATMSIFNKKIKITIEKIQIFVVGKLRNLLHVTHVTGFLLNQTKKVVERSKFSQLGTFGRSNITFQNIKWCKNKVKKMKKKRKRGTEGA
jgi:hypothetical protein